MSAASWAAAATLPAMFWATALLVLEVFYGFKDYGHIITFFQPALLGQVGARPVHAF